MLKNFYPQIAMCVTEIVKFIKNFDNNVMTFNSGNFTMSDPSDKEYFTANIISELYQIYQDNDILYYSESNMYFENGKLVLKLVVNVNTLEYSCFITQVDYEGNFHWCVKPSV